MPFESFAGNFSANTSTGNQAITGIGFTPKAVIFFSTDQTANGVTADAHINFGVGVSSSSRFGMVNTADDGESTATDTTRESSAALCVVTNNAGTFTGVLEADLVTMDSDGFTLNLTTAPGNACRVGFMSR